MSRFPSCSKPKLKSVPLLIMSMDISRLILRLVFLINPILTRPTSTIWLCVLDLLMDLCSVSLMFLHAASRLWNGKAANATPTILDGGVLDNKTSVINVRKQWVTMRFKNNSNRTIRAKHFLCTQSQQSLFTPNQAWYLGINDMISNSCLIGTPTVTQNHLFTHPKTVDQFNQYFSSSETDYTRTWTVYRGEH